MSYEGHVDPPRVTHRPVRGQRHERVGDGTEPDHEDPLERALAVHRPQRSIRDPARQRVDQPEGDV